MKYPIVNLITAIAWAVAITTTDAFVPGATFQRKFHSSVTAGQMAPMSWVSKSDNTTGNKGFHKPVAKTDATANASTATTKVDPKDVVDAVVKNSTQGSVVKNSTQEAVVKNSTQTLLPALVPSSKVVASEKKHEKSNTVAEIVAAVKLDKKEVVDAAPELLIVKNDEILAEEVKEEEMGEEEEEEMDAVEEDELSPEELAQLDWDEKYMHLAIQMAQSAYVSLTLVVLSVLRFGRLDDFVVGHKTLTVALLSPFFGLDLCLLLANSLFSFPSR